jgi:prolyl oligopeptidase
MFVRLGILRSGAAALLMGALGLAFTGSAAQAQAPAGATLTEQPDNYQWLEDVRGDRAMTWVKAHNAASEKIIQADPHYAELQAAALKVLESPERLPIPDFREGVIYNTWRDAQHVQGILRRTFLKDYLTSAPHWQTVLDYDALAVKDKQKWVAHGMSCMYPGDEHCMVALSAGGEDADTMREFNLKAGKTGEFVEGGFVLPTSKQRVSWVDRDTLLVERNWGPGTMTKSGYPYVSKLWKRGQTLEQAKEVFRGTADDVSAGGFVMNDAQGHQVTMFYRSVSFFEREWSLMQADGSVVPLALPKKSDLGGLLDNQLILQLNQDWQPEGLTTTFIQGSVLAIDLDELKKDPAHPKPLVVVAPTAQEFVDDVGITRNHLIVTTLEHVQGRAYVFTHDKKDGWQRKKLDVPDNLAVKIVTTNTSDDKYFLSLTGFLTPSSLLLGDAGKGASLETAKTLPAQFDASKDVVEQFDATSKDGTKVPYFVVRPKDLKYDGSNPTLLNAYGGFQDSETPHYSAVVGKLWLERGGVFVVANIRGGGEFGPAWHEAGLKTHRQRIYDDFAAVGQDLVTRKITSPQKLGIMGGSNGGLLMGVEITQHPEMWKAVVIDIPLLDMLRFEQIAAGASWVGEYGSVSVPEERAFLASISPYNQLRRDVTYPMPLLFTTTKDDRVGPVHARKFAARMEEFGKPFYYQEFIEGGHAAGADLKEDAKMWATMYTYLTMKLME